MKKLFVVIIIACSLFTFSCSDENNASPIGPITIEFDNIVGSANLQLNTLDDLYTNAKGQPYKLRSLAYYISNIKLTRADGTLFEDQVASDGSRGYYLIEESNAASQVVILENVPAGEYTEVTFTVGVDAAQVNQGAQTGALDPAKGFFWSWNSGYIFLALEGSSPASTEPDHIFEYHVGGYMDDASSNQVNNVRTITLSFNGDRVPVRAQHQPEVHVLFDVNKFLNGAGEQITFSENASRHSPKACEKLADNIVGAFVVDHVHAN